MIKAFNLATFNVLLSNADKATLTLQEYVVASGLTHGEARKHVVAYVSKESGTKPHASRKGGDLTFTKDTPEGNRVAYLMRLIFVVPQVGKAKKADPVAKFASAVKSAKSAGLTKAQALKAFERAWAA